MNLPKPDDALKISSSRLDEYIEAFESSPMFLQAANDSRSLKKNDGKDVSDKPNLPEQSRQMALDLREDICLSAPFAYFLSSILCDTAAQSACNCASYHSLWQYLNLFELVSNPSWHEDFYLETLDEFAGRAEYSEILISGSADYTLLAYLIKTFGEKNKNLKVTVLDICSTPLFLCKWYAEKMSFPINAVAGDILTYRFNQPFDLIVADGFLTQFPIDLKEGIVRKWAAGLRPGGRLVTTMRVKLDAGQQSQKSQFPMESFYALAYDKAQQWKEYVAINPDDFVREVRKYIEEQELFPLFKSEEEIRNLFGRNGFQIIDFQIGGPAQSAGTYARIVAENI